MPFRYLFVFVSLMLALPAWGGSLLGLRLAVNGQDLLNNLDDPIVGDEYRFHPRTFSLVEPTVPGTVPVKPRRSALQFEGLMKIETTGNTVEMKFTEAFVTCVVGTCGDVDLELVFGVDLPLGNYVVDSSIEGKVNGDSRIETLGIEITSFLVDTIDKLTKKKNELPGSPRAIAAVSVAKPKSALPRNDTLPEVIVPIAVPGFGNSTSGGIVPVFGNSSSGIILPPKQNPGSGNSPVPDAIDSKLFKQLKKRTETTSFNYKAFLTLFDMKQGDQLELPDSLTVTVTPAPPSAAVPEPATLVLAGAALAAAGLWLRRRR